MGFLLALWFTASCGFLLGYVIGAVMSVGAVSEERNMGLNGHD